MKKELQRETGEIQLFMEGVLVNYDPKTDDKTQRRFIKVAARLKKRAPDMDVRVVVMYPNVNATHIA